MIRLGSQGCDTAKGEAAVRFISTYFFDRCRCGNIRMPTNVRRRPPNAQAFSIGFPHVRGSIPICRGPIDER